MIVTVWSLFIAPGSDGGMSDTAKMWVGSLVLAVCAVALAVARNPVLAGAFAAAIDANSILMQVWHQ